LCLLFHFIHLSIHMTWRDSNPIYICMEVSCKFQLNTLIFGQILSINWVIPHEEKKNGTRFIRTNMLCYKLTVTQKIARSEASTAATLQNLSPRQSCEIEFNPASLVICPTPTHISLARINCLENSYQMDRPCFLGRRILGPFSEAHALAGLFHWPVNV
jgi:hypothetical protein